METQILEKMKEVLSPLKRLEIQIGTGCDDEGEEIGIEIPECRNYLDNNAMHDLLSAAPELEISVSISIGQILTLPQTSRILFNRRDGLFFGN